MKQNLLKVKSKYLFLIMSFWANNIYAQLTIDAGKDTFLCSTPFDSVVLGGNPTAHNGVEPYKFKWSYKIWDKDHNIVNNIRLINDSIPNPVLKFSCLDLYIKFFLKVIDKNNEEKEDSISVIASGIKCIHAALRYQTIKKGDSCKLKQVNIFNGIPPFKYKWTPNYNISDTTIAEPMAWPYESTIYYVELTDSVGCAASDENYIDVITTTIKDNITNPTYEIIPNPITNKSIIKFYMPFNRAFLNIISSNGMVIYSNYTNSKVFEVGKFISKKGMYFFTLVSENNTICEGKFIVQ